MPYSSRRWPTISRVLMPRAYIETILSSKPGKRRWYLAISCGSKLACRSRGTASSILPVSVTTVLRPYPLRLLPAPSSPLRWWSISAFSARSAKAFFRPSSRPFGSNAAFGSAPASSWSRMASGILGSLRRGMSGLLRSYHARPHTKFPTGPEVLAARLLDRRPAGQAVADHVRAGREVPLGQLLHLPLAEALHHAQPQPLGLAFGRGLHGGDDRRLARGAPAPLAARPLAAEVGVVDLDTARELGISRLARRHRPHQLVLHQPGGALLHAQPAAELDRRAAALDRRAAALDRRAAALDRRAAELDRRDAALALGQVVDRREPSDERQLGALEHRPRRQPHLTLAPVALEQLAGLQPTEAAVAASRAGQYLPPRHLQQGLPGGGP